MGINLHNYPFLPVKDPLGRLSWDSSLGFGVQLILNLYKIVMKTNKKTPFTSKLSHSKLSGG